MIEVESDTTIEVLDTLEDIDAANIATGFRLARTLALHNAVLDNRLPPSCHRVLAAISYFMNDTTMRAWPSYALLAEVTDYTEDVSNEIYRREQGDGTTVL